MTFSVPKLIYEWLLKSCKEILLQGTKILQIYSEIKEKIILKGNAAITYIEHKNKNAGTSVLIHPQNVEKRYR